MFLGQNLEVAAALTLQRTMAYQKGFADGTLLREFCEPFDAAPYWPIGDSRPAAARWEWGQELDL